jgi:16S rRNA (adenine1518-N6/adenine1519-N6)-dimethyltransferase
VRAAAGRPLSGPDGQVALLTPSEIRRLLADHGLAPRKTAGQNFVIDPNTVRRIVAEAGLRPDDVVVEIGPGLGSLTLALADRVHHVLAIEVDRGLVGALKEVLASRGPTIAGRVTVVHADALAVDLAELVASAAGALDAPPGEGDAARRGVRLVANLPYNVATPLVVRGLESGVFDDLFVMVQREVGERWIAAPGSRLRAAVSVKIDRMAHATIVMSIPRQVFYPVPNVDSVMVRLARRAGADPLMDDLARRRRWFDLVDRAFAQRRKTLRNAWGRGDDRQRVEAAALAAGIDLGLRAETLSTEEFVTMLEALEALEATAQG